MTTYALVHKILGIAILVWCVFLVGTTFITSAKWQDRCRAITIITFFTIFISIVLNEVITFTYLLFNE